MYRCSLCPELCTPYFLLAWRIGHVIHNSGGHHRLKQPHYGQPGDTDEQRLEGILKARPGAGSRQTVGSFPSADKLVPTCQMQPHGNPSQHDAHKR